jgi:hypothetical protein
VVKGILAASLLATPIVAQGNFVPPQQQDSGLVGLAMGQTARFSVLYPGIPAPVALVQVPITLIIEDDQGNTLASQDFVLTGGIGRKAAAISVNADTIMPAGMSKLLIHAYSLIPGNQTGKFPLVLPGLDIVDSAIGRTSVHLETRVTYPREADPDGAVARIDPKL